MKISILLAPLFLSLHVYADDSVPIDLSIENHEKIFFDAKNQKIMGDWLVYFTVDNEECEACTRMLPQIINLASLTKSKPQVGIINCNELQELCRILDLQDFPTLLSFQNNKSYRFRTSKLRDPKNPPSAKLIYESIVTSKDYASIYAADVHKFIKEKMQRNMAEVDPIEEQIKLLDYHFGRMIGYIFYQLGRDHWTKEAKIACFIIMTIGPFVALLMKIVCVCCCCSEDKSKVKDQ